MRTKLVWLLAGALLSAAVFAGVTAIDDGSKAAAAPAATADVSHVDQQAVESGRALARDLSLAFQHATELVKPAVVPIYSERPAPRVATFMPLDDDLLRRFFGDRAPRVQPQEPDDQPTVRGLGSGVIVSKDGVILTNNHVVEGASELYVMLNDERYDATLVGADPATDLAVVKIDPKKVKGELPVAELGASDDVHVGQWVIAVGNPLGLLHTVTAGIVSAKGRAAGLAEYEDFIQTDASINQGNSGGALADLEGRVIGINTAIASPSGGSIGIGFAIPIDMAKTIMADLLNDGQVSRGYLALLPQDIDSGLAKALHLDSRKGALVADVTADGPADKAGIERGDVVVAFEGKDITDSADLRNKVASVEPGSKATLTVLRDGHKRDIKVELGERPQPQGSSDRAMDRSEKQSYEKLGLQLTDLNARLRSQLELPDEVQGVLVVGVSPGSPADRAGLERGDVVLEAAAKPTKSVEELKSVLADQSSGDTVALVVRRGPVTNYIALEMP